MVRLEHSSAHRGHCVTNDMQPCLLTCWPLLTGLQAHADVWCPRSCGADVAGPAWMVSPALCVCSCIEDAALQVCCPGGE